MRTLHLLLLSGAAATLAGCLDDRHIGWERERTVIGPVPLKDKVAYVDTGRDRVVVLDTAGAVPRVDGIPIGRRAIYATPTPDRQKLAVITRGEEAVARGQVDQDPGLWIVDVANPDTAPTEYAIGSPFDRLAISADGRVAVAYFSGAGPDEEGFFRNPNELAVVHLDQPPGAENPTLKTVRSFGSVPDGVVLSPPMALPGADDPTPRIFAFILALNNVTVLDATYPARNEVSIRLDTAGAQVRPREMVFAPASATAYLRSDNARDVLEIILSYEAPAEGNPRDNDYRPALAELGAGGGPADIAVYDDAAARRFVLAATPGTREVVVIDADTAQFATVATPDPIDRIILFPNDPDVVPRTALLASIGSQTQRVHLLSLDGLTEDLVRARLETIELDEPVLDVVPVPGRELAMVVHSDDRTVLGLLDIRFGSVSPLQGVGRLDTYDFTADGAYLVGATTGVERVGFLELENLHPSDMRLDDPPARVFALPGGAVVVDHGDPFGRATVLPRPGAARAESFVVSGFLLDDLLDQDF
jgi:hypothetical protein